MRDYWIEIHLSKRLGQLDGDPIPNRARSIRVKLTGGLYDTGEGKNAEWMSIENRYNSCSDRKCHKRQGTHF